MDEKMIYECDECGEAREVSHVDPAGHGDWGYILTCGHLVYGWIGA